MYAIIETGGKQIRVEEGSTIFVEKLDVQEGEAVVFDKVVAYCNRSLRVGTPYVKGVKVNAKVEKQGKAKKMIIGKEKCRVITGLKRKTAKANNRGTRIDHRGRSVFAEA